MTAESNKFQAAPGAAAVALQATALREFDGVRLQLERSGIRVICIEDTIEPPKPDAVFPNNWISTHADGRVVLYPMEAANRRTERRRDVVDQIAEAGFHVSEIVDLSGHETYGQYLEGTGSLVLDRRNRLAYACLSSRTNMDALGDFAQRLDYEPIAFAAQDRNGDPIYHTNVMMNIGPTLAVVCAEAVPDASQRTALLDSLQSAGHEIVEITMEQMADFAGNMLALMTPAGAPVLLMSERARESLTVKQIATLEKHHRLIDVAIDTIETASGGSVRCMLAEIHLPAEEQGESTA